MINVLRLWLVRSLVPPDYVVVCRQAERIVLLPDAKLECMRCENQHPFLSEQGRSELGIE